MKKSFIIHCDSLSVMDKMTDEQVGKLLRLMKSYHNGKTYDCDDLAVELVFEQFKNQFDRDLEKYEKVCERNRKNGLLGGKPKVTQSNPTKPTGVQSPPIAPDNDNDNDNKKRTRKFIPPSIEQVKDYFKEKGYREDVAIKAYNYYDSNGWADSRDKKVINRKQKMIGVWFKDENKSKQEQLQEQKSKFTTEADAEKLLFSLTKKGS